MFDVFLLVYLFKTCAGLILHDLWRATDQIGYDMKRRVIAEDRGIWLKSRPLRSTFSHYTTNYSRLCFPLVRRNLISLKSLNLYKRYDGLRFYLMYRDRLHRRMSHTTRCCQDVGVLGGSSHVVVSSKSCSVRPASQRHNRLVNKRPVAVNLWRLVRVFLSGSVDGFALPIKQICICMVHHKTVSKNH